MKRTVYVDIFPLQITITSLLAASEWAPRGGKQKVLAGMWLILSVIISTVYRSNLKAMLIKPHLVLPFSNLPELVESGIPCLTFRGTLLHRNIEASLNNI